jgi:leader peptidase (prepilin peptidase)/N-methyltransferase
LSALGAAGFFLVIFLISRGKWLGFGDVKLVFLMGLFLGFPKILVALFFAYLIGAIIGIGLVLAKKKTLKSEVPFGPFLVTGTFIALFFGSQLINWYLGFIQIIP